ncbi:hypothetical protein X474_19875 [Dethiosulfatarculus sandiegensis]|uniref:Uncharacterized protein n=1 Tax=Dethiosulfatarculus sandiegensis TaxID=1429043 RepID=A0A0D2GBK9_9BACT|nr:hypothetical protein X474_19875 [Dethiosulfatarculus sandiegensis]
MKNLSGDYYCFFGLFEAAPFTCSSMGPFSFSTVKKVGLGWKAAP